jgi:hypothetical protein
MNIMKKNFEMISQFVVSVILVMLAFEGVSMSLFKNNEEEVVLFTKMEGHITYKGKPVSNAKIERRVNWKDDIGEKDYFETDDKGYFLLPEIRENITLSGFTQFVVGQEIKVFFNNKEIYIWSMGKRSKYKYGELDGNPMNFRCELTDEDKPMRLKNGLLMTKCKWDKIESVNNNMEK